MNYGLRPIGRFSALYQQTKRPDPHKTTDTCTVCLLIWSLCRPDVSVQPRAFLHLKSKQNVYHGRVQLLFGKDPVLISVATVLVNNLPLKDERFLYGPPDLLFRYSLRFAHTLYLCVLYGFQNKQRLFPYTTLTAWFLWTTELTENT
jgi:hypothetical protein